VSVRFTKWIVGENNKTAPRWTHLLPGVTVSILRVRSFVKAIFLCKYTARMRDPHSVVFVSTFATATPSLNSTRCER
jgi:hypothetical protein